MKTHDTHDTHDAELDGKPIQQWHEGEGEGPPTIKEVGHSSTVALAIQYLPDSPKEKGFSP